MPDATATLQPTRDLKEFPCEWCGAQPGHSCMEGSNTVEPHQARLNARRLDRSPVTLVERALKGVQLSADEAEQLQAVIAARVRKVTALETMTQRLDLLRGKVDPPVLHALRNGLSDVLKEQVDGVIGAARAAAAVTPDPWDVVAAVTTYLR